ncbi:MAG: ADP-ribosylglycohydrolase family protein [Candidatus Merdivicinus sp.]|jgi:ADP-ribosylglycohydrolase
MSNHDFSNMTAEQLQAVANKMYPGMALYARDVNLPEELAEKYTPGRILREKGFTDASDRFIGMVTTHRYVILSNHMADLSGFEHGTNWGLHTANKDSHFKVLGKVTVQGKTGIFLLHLPDDDSWKLWKTAEFSMDQELYEKAVQRFTIKCKEPPVLELTTPQWLGRCAFPVGMQDDGMFFPLEDAKAPADPREIMRSRYLGCLLGGAVGDALGYPVEFTKEPAIWAKYGPKGIQNLSQAGDPAVISDDTQMTLFAANALIYAKEHGTPLSETLWLAYREWLGTQGDQSRMDGPAKMWIYGDQRLHARRAPGLSCLNAIRQSKNGGDAHNPVNNSKGCGSVMRAAPFGLAQHYDPVSSRGDDFIGIHKLGVGDAVLTHGHPLAWASSSALAQIIFHIVQYRPKHDYPLQDAVLQICLPRGMEEVYALLNRAVKLALDRSVSDLDGIHALGEGWVAEEALAIAVFCAVRYQNDFAAGIRASVNHKGDSDSTGAICGNILGAWLGKEAVEAAFDLNQLELRDVVEKMADQLFQSVCVPRRQEGFPFNLTGKAADEYAVPRSGSGHFEDFQPQPIRQPDPPKAEPLKPLRPVGLLYTPLTKQAMAICFDVHKNQRDKGGLPYVFHPFHLAEQMETEEEICTALLHDVVEDSPYTLEDLRRAGFPEPVLEALRLLTRNPGEDYLAYVERLRRHPIARRVKLADLRHNSDINRLDTVGEWDKKRLDKYRMALRILESSQEGR